MAEEKFTIEFESRGADDVAADLRDVADGARDAGESVERAGTQAGSFTDAIAKAGLKLAALKTLVVDSTRAFAAQQAAVGRLDRSWSKSTGTAEQYQRAMAEISKRSLELGVGYNEQIDALSQLVDQTGNAQTANEDLALAVDIAAQEHRELKDIVELLRKARNGEVDELKNLDGINQDVAQSLAQISDSGERAEVAISRLREAYAGAAEENQGLENRLAALEQGSVRLTAALGKVVVALGDQAGGLIGSTLEYFGILKSEEMTLTNTVTAFENLANAIANVDVAQLVELSASGGLLGLALGTNDELVAELRSAADKGKGKAPTGDGSNKPAPGKKQGESVRPMDDLDKALNASGEEIEAHDKKRALERQRRLQDEERARKQAHADRMAALRERQDAEDRHHEAENRRHETTLDNLAEERRARTEAAQAAIDALKKQEDADARKAGEDQKVYDARLQLEQDVAGASADAAAAIAGSVIENEGAKAAILSAMEAAKAIAASFENPAAAIAHGVAAAQFAIIAAKAGRGGPKAKGGGGGAAGARSQRSRDREDASLLGERARSSGAPAVPPLVVNIQSSFPPSPEQAAALANAVHRDAIRRS